NILDHLLRDPGYLTEPVLDSFYDAEMLQPLGQLTYGQYMLLRHHGTDKATLDALQDTTLYFLNRIVKLDSLIFQEPGNIVALIGSRSSNADSLSIHAAEWLELVAEIESAFIDDYDAIRDEVSGISASFDLDNSLKKSLLILAKYLLQEAWTSTDTAQVLSFAEQCTWQGGRSLPMAQMLYAIQFDSILSHIPYPCSSPLVLAVDDVQPQELRLSVYPSPSSGFLKIVGTIDPDHLRIYSTDGVLMYAGKFNTFNRQIDISSLQSGIYILVAMQDGHVFTSKFVRL